MSPSSTLFSFSNSFSSDGDCGSFAILRWFHSRFLR
uniref:Uncharacterized protein n=1 Tax=Lotus japonicus TaxID=34305 RepID=I3S3Y5_LOTJA|nr:unknown [Lotus japonicus]